MQVTRPSPLSLTPRPGLLVSVRSSQEAEAAFQGGAHIIDVKEPDHGSLGRADDRVISAVIDQVAGRRPVSAALGELADGLPPCRDQRLTFVKWGLAGCGTIPNPRPGDHRAWQNRLDLELSQPGSPQTVIVAYADWQCAHAPEISEIVAFACQKPGNVLLIDTHCKEPETLRKDRTPTLLDWLTLNEISALCAQCHAASVRVALAGSLTIVDIERLRSAGPDWFAVRGAVCEGGKRRGTVDADKVRRIVKLILRVGAKGL
jgi:(5-formylfuran-3-yl)methyl phosphate synthase